MLEFREAADHLHHHPTGQDCRVDSLGEGLEARPLGLDILDDAQRLEGERVRDVISGDPERMVLPTHGEHSGARRIALVEDGDLRAGIAPELQCDQRQEHRFACASWTDDRERYEMGEGQCVDEQLANVGVDMVRQ